MGVRQQPQDQYHIETCSRFCADVEALVRESNKKADDRERESGRPTLRLSYVDAVLVIAEKNRIEPDLAAAYLNPEIKEKLRMEYENRHMLPKTAKLPF